MPVISRPTLLTEPRSSHDPGPARRRIVRPRPATRKGVSPISGTYTLRRKRNSCEAKVNPFGAAVNSNPFRFLATPTGFAVADAGGNDILKVGFDGPISTLAVLPGSNGMPPYQPVPTSITLGHDGAYYVGELTGLP